jgi:hypothetical protein
MGKTFLVSMVVGEKFVADGGQAELYKALQVK